MFKDAYTIELPSICVTFFTYIMNDFLKGYAKFETFIEFFFRHNSSKSGPQAGCRKSSVGIVIYFLLETQM